MVDVNIFKKNVRDIVSQDYKLEFLGDNFDKIVLMLSETKADGIYNWIKNVVQEELRPMSKPISKKKYKNWMIHDLLSFKKEINIEKSHYRLLLIKVKNSFYIEFHLSNHKYYDKLRKSLGLTQKDY